MDRLRRITREASWPLATVAVLLIVWEGAVRVFDVPDYVLPTPTAILGEIWTERSELWVHSLSTLWAVVAGFGLAIVVSVPLAFLIAYSSLLEKTVYPLLIFSQTVPKIAIVPVFTVWFGFGVLPKVLIAFLICFFPIVIDTIIGLRSVSPEMLKLIRSMRGSRLEAFRRVRVPNALPYFFSGLKVAVTLAVVGAVVGEFVGSTTGLGFVIVQASSLLDNTLMFAAIFLLTVIGIALFYLVDLLERIAVPWHVTQRSEQAGETVKTAPESRVVAGTA